MNDLIQVFSLLVAKIKPKVYIVKITRNKKREVGSVHITRDGAEKRVIAHKMLV